MMSRNEVCRMYESAVRTYERVMTFTNSRHWMHSLCHLRGRNSEREREWESERARERDGARGSECEIQREREREREKARARARMWELERGQARERQEESEYVCMCVREKKRGDLDNIFKHVAYILAYMHACTHMQAPSYVANTHTHTHTKRNTNTHIHTHTHTHTNTHTPVEGIPGGVYLSARTSLTSWKLHSKCMYVYIYIDIHRHI